MNNTNRKTFVLDTNVFIDNPDVLNDGIFAGNDLDFVIPADVFRELDGLKKSQNEEKARAARAASKRINQIAGGNDLAKGVELDSKKIVRISNEYRHIDVLASRTDNRVIGTALKLKEHNPDVSVISNDYNVRTASRMQDVKAYEYEVPAWIVAERKRKERGGKSRGTYFRPVYTREVSFRNILNLFPVVGIILLLFGPGALILGWFIIIGYLIIKGLSWYNDRH